MLTFLPPPLRGAISLIFYTLNTLFWATPLLLLALVKLVLPNGGWRRLCDRCLNQIASAWIAGNNLNQRLVNRTRYEVSGIDGLRPDDWYLVLANHQSWVDILVLQRIFHRRIPFLKFFLKKELIWVPVLGLCWWALEFPFMKRYSKALIERKPHLRGKDLEITRRACEKFKQIPVSVMNFVEGTRFSPEKHRRQQSPYRHLLKPKSGGIAFVLAAMGRQMHRVLDVTIVYPHRRKSFWDFLCGRVREVRVNVRELPVTDELLGDYFDNPDFRVTFQSWLNALWDEKDRRIATLLPDPPNA